MNRYTVTWREEAEAELIELWLAASDRSEITAAVRIIDQALAIDPETKGNAVAEGLMSYIAPPIRVLFVVQTEDRTVDIQLVRRI
jgi:hypothetical protein